MQDGNDQNATLFSTKDFIEAWSRSLGSKYSPLAIPVTGSETPRKMYALQTSDRYGSRYVSLGPVGLYASPGWNGQLDRSTLGENPAQAHDVPYERIRLERPFRS